MNCTILTKTGTAQNGSQVDRHSLVAVAMLLLLLTVDFRSAGQARTSRRAGRARVGGVGVVGGGGGVGGVGGLVGAP
jgi:hypothetical protein